MTMKRAIFLITLFYLCATTSAAQQMAASLSSVVLSCTDGANTFYCAGAEYMSIKLTPDLSAGCGLMYAADIDSASGSLPLYLALKASFGKRIVKPVVKARLGWSLPFRNTCAPGSKVFLRIHPEEYYLSGLFDEVSAGIEVSDREEGSASLSAGVGISGYGVGVDTKDGARCLPRGMAPHFSIVLAISFR